MAKSPSGTGSLPEGKPLQTGPAKPKEAIGLNLSENANADAQRRFSTACRFWFFLSGQGKLSLPTRKRAVAWPE
jgi:hypothetical protein